MKAARIAILGIAVVAGGLAALLASGSDTPPAAPAPVVQIDTVDVLVAKKDLNIGQTVGADDLRWQTWPTAAASSVFIRRNDRAEAIQQFTGSIARAPLAAGEPVREGKLIKGQGSGYMAAILPAGMRAVSMEISPEASAGGFILPNDRVDVILSRRDREQERTTGLETQTSETILKDVRVLAIDQNFEEKNGQRVIVGRTATIELTPRQVETLAVSRQMGTLSLALRSMLDANRSAEPTDDNANNRGRMNMVRFGVSTTILPK